MKLKKLTKREARILFYTILAIVALIALGVCMYCMGKEL